VKGGHLFIWEIFTEHLLCAWHGPLWNLNFSRRNKWKDGHVGGGPHLSRIRSGWRMSPGYLVGDVPAGPKTLR
jgi:hypothetical protein